MYMSPHKSKGYQSVQWIVYSYQSSLSSGIKGYCLYLREFLMIISVFSCLGCSIYFAVTSEMFYCTVRYLNKDIMYNVWRFCDASVVRSKFLCLHFYTPSSSCFKKVIEESFTIVFMIFKRVDPFD